MKLENFQSGASTELSVLQRIARQLGKHHEVVTHYLTEHGYIPLWVLVNVLTFGKVTTFYYNLHEQDKIDIARQFKLSYKELHKYMTMAGFARNKCAHDERFYNIRLKEFVSSMDSAFKKLDRQLVTVSINDILKIMGYPSNWKDILKL